MVEGRTGGAGRVAAGGATVTDGVGAGGFGVGASDVGVGRGDAMIAAVRAVVDAYGMLPYHRKVIKLIDRLLGIGGLHCAIGISKHTTT